MAKTTYKDKKTGKPLSKKTVENYKPIKKLTSPKIKKVGKIYKIAKNNYKEGI